MSVFKAAGMVRPFVKAGLDGYQGSGKSLTAAAILAGIYREFKAGGFFVIDNEKNSKFLLPFLAQQGVKDVQVVETDSLAVWRDGLEEVCRVGGCLLVDSLTKFSYRMERDFLAGLRSPRDMIQVQDRPILNSKWMTMFEEPFISAACHIVFTGRAAIDWGNTTEEDERTGKEKQKFYAKGVKMQGQKDTLYAPDFVMYMERMERLDQGSNKKDVWRECTVTKDRSRILDGKTFSWHADEIGRVWNDLAPMFRFLLSSPAGAPNVQQGEPTAVFAKQESDDRKPVLEEIQATLTEAHPDRTEAGKAAKGRLLKEAFGTASWTAIGKMTVDELRMGQAKLSGILKPAAPAEPPPPPQPVAPPVPPQPPPPLVDTTDASGVDFEF